MNKSKLLEELKNISFSLKNIENSIANIILLLEKADENQQIINTTKNEKNELAYIKPEELLNFLKSRNLETISFSEELDNQTLNKIAKFLGNKYQYIKDFLLELKRSLSSGKIIKMFLQNESQEKISYICQLANMLNEIAYLENFRYFNSPKYLLIANPLRQPQVINYINGKWLEHFLILKIKEILDRFSLKENIDYSYIYNIKLRLPNGNQTELDILFKIKNNIYWFEAKTGDYQRYVHKYSEISQKLLKLPKGQSFMIITDITNVSADTVSELFNMTVCNLLTFEEKFIKSIKSEVDLLKTAENEQKEAIQ